MKTGALLLTKNYIKQWCGSSSVYERGSSYFVNGRVAALKQDDYDMSWNAKVAGRGDKYEVVVHLMNGEIDATCDCPAFDTYPTCKHIVAVLLEIAQTQTLDIKKRNIDIIRHRKSMPDLHQYQKTSQMIASFMSRSMQVEEDKQTYHKQPLVVEYICRTYATRSTAEHKLFKIEVKIGVKRPYVVKDLSKFLKCIEDHSAYVFTSRFTYNPSEHYFVEEDQEIIQMLQEVMKQEELYRYQQGYYSSYYSSHDSERCLLIPPGMADELFSKLQGRNVVFDDQSGLSFQPHVEERKLPVSFRLQQGLSEDFRLDLASLQSVSYYEPYGWMVQKNTIYKLSSAQKELLDSIYFLRNQSSERSLPIAPNQIGKFISYVIPALKQMGRVEISEKVSDHIISPPLTAKVFIDRDDDRIVIKVEYHYDHIVLHPFQSEATEEINNGMILIRETEKEQAIMKMIESTPFKYNGKECYLEGEEEIYDFLFTSVPKLEGKAEIYMTDAVQSLTSSTSYI